MLMMALIIAMMTSQIWNLPTAPENMKNLPMKPAVNGIPARESMAMVKTKARKGLLLPRPLKLSKLSFPLCCCTNINTAKAMIEATE